MVFYELKGAVGEGWTAAVVVAGYVAGSAKGAGMWVGTAGEKLFGAGRMGVIAGLGMLVQCDDETPSLRLLGVEGGGSDAGRQWSIWRVQAWSDEVVTLTPAERETLAARRDYVNRQIRIWEELQAADPGRAMRPIEALRVELTQIDARLEPVGDLFVALPLGYGKHYDHNRYIVPGF